MQKKIKNGNMEIYKGEGLGNIIFGMREDDIIKILGLSDRSFIDEYDNKILEYYNLLLSLQFEKENEDKLGWITTKNTEISFMGKKVIGKIVEDIIPFFNKKLKETPEVELYDTMSIYNYNENCISLEFSINTLDFVKFGNLFDKNNQPIYPQ